MAALALPGAAWLRVPHPTAEEMRRLVATIRERCHPFLTYSGFNSLYFWTEQAPPTLDLVPHDIRLLSAEREDAMLAALARSPTSCFVRVPPIKEGPLDPEFKQKLLPEFAVDSLGLDDSTVARVGNVLVCNRRAWRNDR